MDDEGKIRQKARQDATFIAEASSIALVTVYMPPRIRISCLLSCVVFLHILKIAVANYACGGHYLADFLSGATLISDPSPPLPKSSADDVMVEKQKKLLRCTYTIRCFTSVVILDLR